MGGDKIPIDAAEAASALQWWLEAGVDVAVQESPRNWLEGERAPPPAAERPLSPAGPPEQIPDSLELFRDWLATNRSLPLAAAGAAAVRPVGSEQAAVMLLVDAPSAEDASAGRPVAGDAWELAVRMLAAIGIGADQAYCAGLSCFHAPGARLSSDELKACGEIARRHVALVRPQRLLLLGDGPCRAVLGKPLVAARGHVHKVEGVRSVATFHPRQLLTRPSDKALAWRDLLLLTEDQL